MVVWGGSGGLAGSGGAPGAAPGGLQGFELDDQGRLHAQASGFAKQGVGQTQSGQIELQGQQQGVRQQGQRHPDDQT